MSVIDLARALWSEIVGQTKPIDDEIAASDRRIESKLRQAREILESPDTPKETIDAATVCLDSITLDFRKQKGDSKCGK